MRRPLQSIRTSRSALQNVLSEKMVDKLPEMITITYEMKKILWATVFASLIIGGSACATENLVEDGKFERGTDNCFFAGEVEGKEVTLPERLEVVKLRGNALRVSFTEDDEHAIPTLHTHAIGVRLLLSAKIYSESDILIKLKARSISGAGTLVIGRKSGGSSILVAELGLDWKTIEGRIQLAHEMSDLHFSLSEISFDFSSSDAEEVDEGVYQIKTGIFPVKEGIFEIADVSVELVPSEAR